MFITDDHGAWSTGADGCYDARTPNIDGLAAGGAKFSRASACTPVCSTERSECPLQSTPANWPLSISTRNEEPGEQPGQEKTSEFLMTAARRANRSPTWEGSPVFAPRGLIGRTKPCSASRTIPQQSSAFRITPALGVRTPENRSVRTSNRLCFNRRFAVPAREISSKIRPRHVRGTRPCWPFPLQSGGRARGLALAPSLRSTVQLNGSMRFRYGQCLRCRVAGTPGRCSKREPPGILGSGQPAFPPNRYIETTPTKPVGHTTPDVLIEVESDRHRLRCFFKTLLS